MRPTSKYRPLLANRQWPAIVRDILIGECPARDEARALLWQEVQRFVEHVVRLPIGPLNDDEDVRRDIALRVLGKLERNSNAHLAEWFARQLERRDHSSFWTWIRTITKSCAIDHARTSRLNVASRSTKQFAWVRVDSVDPMLLNDVLGSPRSYLPCGCDEDLEQYLAVLQDRLRDEAGAPDRVWDDDLLSGRLAGRGL